MFNGLQDNINAALIKASHQALTTGGKIEIEFRLKSFQSVEGEQAKAKGVKNRNAGTFKKTLREFRAYCQSLPDNWSVMPPQKDFVFPCNDFYRIIQTEISTPASTPEPSPEGGPTSTRPRESKKIEQKVEVPDGRIISTTYPVVLSFSVEREVDALPPSVKLMAGERRDRTRWSFEYRVNPVSPPLIRVDMTKADHYKANLPESDSYEIEVEALGLFDKIDQTPEGLLLLGETQQIMNDVMILLLRINTQTRFIYDFETRSSVIYNINWMFDRSLKGKTNVGKRIFDTRINKPIPLQWKDLETGREDSMFPDIPGRDLTPADASYAVTIKADGERVFVFWAPSGVWLFNLGGGLNRISDKEVPELTGSLIDGELVGVINDSTRSASNPTSAAEYRVLIFDCIYSRIYPPSANREPELRDAPVDIRLRPLGERLWCARYTTKHSNLVSTGPGKLVLEVKDFVPFWDRTSFYSANVTALRMNKDRNNAEIFKSDGLVYTDTGIYLHRAKDWKTNPSRNRKFKELDQLTVDFYIDRDENNRTIVMVVGVVKIGGEEKAVMLPFTGEPKNHVEATQIASSFLDPSNERIELTTGMIVECRWDKQAAQWLPIRLREDRLDPNKLGVALDTWRLIHDNIPIGILVNKIKGNKVLELANKFVNRIKIATLNHWATEIARGLQESGDKSRPRLLDMGSGKGGDVDKWKQAGFEVIAVEPDASRDGLATLEERAEKAGMLGRIQTVNIGIQNSDAILTKFTNLGIKKVDMITSFHMMTFLYESAESVNGFIRTITGLLKPGGILAIMAMDGLLIHQQLGDNQQAAIEGIKIQRSQQVGPNGEPDPRKIMVKLRVKDQRLARGQIEYLVDFDDLITRLESNGFELINDNHLSSAVALNDSELWWSQMTRIIELRYIGVPGSIGGERLDPSKERLAQLNDIMINALGVSKSLPVDHAQEFPSETLSFLKGINVAQSLYTVGVLGGGSCFLHAILWARSQNYRSLKQAQRIERVAALRRELSANFTLNEYNALADGAIAELGADDNAYSYQTLKSGLANYGYWFGLEFLIYVSNQLNLNIHLVWLVGDKLEVYEHAPELSLTYNPTRPNVILYWQGGGHFQPVGRNSDGGEIASVFASQDTLIQQMVTK